METPAIQFSFPAPPPAVGGAAPDGFADLIDALLDSMAQVDDLGVGMDGDGEPAPSGEEQDWAEETPPPVVPMAMGPVLAIPALALAPEPAEPEAISPTDAPGPSGPEPILPEAAGTTPASQSGAGPAADVQTHGSSLPETDPTPEDGVPMWVAEIPIAGVHETRAADPVPATIEAPVTRPVTPVAGMDVAGEEPVRVETSDRLELIVREEAARPAPRRIESQVEAPESPDLPVYPRHGELAEAQEGIRPDLGVVIDRIEEWMEHTGGREPTTIAVELPDPDGDLLVRVALRDGRLDLSVTRTGGEAPGWLIDQLDEALIRHGFELADDRHHRPRPDDPPEGELPVRQRPRRRPAATEGLLI